MATMTAEPVEFTEPRTVTETLGSRIASAAAAKAKEKAAAYAARPVAPGATREQLVDNAKPWAAITAVVLAAAAARAGMDASEADAAIALSVAVAAFAAAVVLGMIAKRRLLCAKRRARVYAFLAACAGWVTATLATGVNEPMLYLLAVLGVGMSLWHWADGRLGYDWSAPAMTPVEAPQQDIYGPRWAQNLAAPGRVLADTRLMNWEPLKFGSRYAVEVVAGTHTIDEVESYSAKIRSGLRLKQNHKLIIEEHPELEAPTLLLTIIDRSPVADGISWPGETAMNRDGTIRIGRYLDGEGKPLWKLYSANRIHNGMLAGGTGSGKSRLLENIAMTAATSTLFPTAVWFADGQDGLSSPLLMRHADYYAGKPEQIVALLEEAVRVIEIQGEENKVLGVQGFRPTPERPGLLVILDECKLVLDRQNNPDFYDRTQQLVARIATTGNKAGVGIILAGQEATLPTFGGAGQFPAAIRNNIKGANGILLKTEEAAGGNIFGIPAATMRSIPAGGGYGYVAGGEGSRKAMMRGFFDDDMTTERNMQSIAWRTVSSMTALDLSTAYRDRKLTAGEDLEAAKARVEARRRRHAAMQAGVALPDQPKVDVFTATGKRSPRVAAPASGFTSLNLPAPFWKNPSRGLTLTAGQDRVLRAVRAGNTGWQDVGQAAGLGREQTYRYLNELVTKGLIEKPRQGVYLPAGKVA